MKSISLFGYTPGYRNNNRVPAWKSLARKAEHEFVESPPLPTSPLREEESLKWRTQESMKAPRSADHRDRLPLKNGRTL